jgi:hypothetical protein
VKANGTNVQNSLARNRMATKTDAIQEPNTRSSNLPSLPCLVHYSVERINPNTVAGESGMSVAEHSLSFSVEV